MKTIGSGKQLNDLTQLTMISRNCSYTTVPSLFGSTSWTILITSAFLTSNPNALINTFSSWRSMLPTLSASNSSKASFSSCFWSSESSGLPAEDECIRSVRSRRNGSHYAKTLCNEEDQRSRSSTFLASTFNRFTHLSLSLTNIQIQYQHAETSNGNSREE